MLIAYPVRFALIVFPAPLTRGLGINLRSLQQRSLFCAATLFLADSDSIHLDSNYSSSLFIQNTASRSKLPRPTQVEVATCSQPAAKRQMLNTSGTSLLAALHSKLNPNTFKGVLFVNQLRSHMASERIRLTLKLGGVRRNQEDPLSI